MRATASAESQTEQCGSDSWVKIHHRSSTWLINPPIIQEFMWPFPSCSVQFSSGTQSCLTLCNPMNCSTPGLPVHHQLLESTQTHVHWVADAIQPSHPLSSPSPAPNLSQHQDLFQWVSSPPNLSQHQDLFQWVSSSHQLAKVLVFQLQHQSFQWTPRTELL